MTDEPVDIESPESEDPQSPALEGSPPELAMASRRQRLTGSAVGVGSVGFDESGAFDVGADEHHPEDAPITDDPPVAGKPE